MESNDEMIAQAEQMSDRINELIAYCSKHWDDDELIEASELLARAQNHIKNWKKEKEEE